jgi:plastocyanin
VTITGNSFGDDFTIAAGDSVVFVNDAGVDHTVTNGVEGTANEDALFNVELATGETSDPIVFDEPGTYDVTCLIHPSMQLTITVE